MGKVEEEAIEGQKKSKMAKSGQIVKINKMAKIGRKKARNGPK